MPVSNTKSVTKIATSQPLWIRNVLLYTGVGRTHVDYRVENGRVVWDLTVGARTFTVRGPQDAEAAIDALT